MYLMVDLIKYIAQIIQELRVSESNGQWDSQETMSLCLGTPFRWLRMSWTG
jgi:hypothetical protein